MRGWGGRTQRDLQGEQSNIDTEWSTEPPKECIWQNAVLCEVAGVGPALLSDARGKPCGARGGGEGSVKRELHLILGPIQIDISIDVTGWNASTGLLRHRCWQKSRGKDRLIP